MEEASGMKPLRVVIHCSATPNGVEVPLANIRRQHMEENGWSNVGYHGIINPNGDWEQGRPFNEKGAHVKGANEGSIGICLIGTDRFTKAQFKTLDQKLDGILMAYQIPVWEIWCHHEFPSAKLQGKECPSMRAVNLIAWYLGHNEAIEPYLLKEK
jgi:N-acetylmuramoyl-L-alanine amidase